jgi:hypothetical protein
LPTARASCGGIGGVYQREVSSSVRSFGDKPFLEVAPALIQNALAEVAVAYQIGDLHGFEGNQVVVLGVVVGLLVE